MDFDSLIFCPVWPGYRLEDSLNQNVPKFRTFRSNSEEAEYPSNGLIYLKDT